jgi:hypothetical protein
MHFFFQPERNSFVRTDGRTDWLTEYNGFPTLSFANGLQIGKENGLNLPARINIVEFHQPEFKWIRRERKHQLFRLDPVQNTETWRIPLRCYFLTPLHWQLQKVRGVAMKFPEIFRSRLTRVHQVDSLLCKPITRRRNMGVLWNATASTQVALMRLKRTWCKLKHAHTCLYHDKITWLPLSCVIKSFRELHRHLEFHTNHMNKIK